MLIARGLTAISARYMVSESKNPPFPLPPVGEDFGELSCTWRDSGNLSGF